MATYMRRIAFGIGAQLALGLPLAASLPASADQFVSVQLPMGSQLAPSLSLGTATTGLFSVPEGGSGHFALGFTAHCPFAAQCWLPVVLTSHGEMAR